MDKRTRVLNALNQREVDHVPVGFWHHFDGELAMGEPNIQAHLAYYRDVELDFAKIMCDGYFTYPMDEPVSEPNDWYRLRPLTAEHPFIREQVERAKRIVDALAKDRCVFYNVFAPFSSIRFGFGEPLVIDHLRRDSRAVMYALDVIAQTNALLSEKLIAEAGCDGVYYCVQGGERDRFQEKEYREWIAPSDLSVLERANRFSQNNIMHCCGWAGAQNNLNLWKDYPAKCVNWAVYVEGVSLPEGRALFGGKACLGGFQTLHQPDGSFTGLLYSGAKEEIQAHTKSLIADFGKKGLLLGGDCTISAQTPHERLRWVIEAASEA